MSAALKLNQEDQQLSQKPPLGEKRPRLRLVWENPELTADRHKEKSEAKPGSSYGRELYNYMRYYDPEIGRYITTDPLGLIAGINTYTYAAGNPLAAIDPTGEIIPVVAGWLVKSLFSATVAVVLEIASQYFFNGGHIECIDWADVIMMGVVGAATFGLPGLGKAYKSYKARKELSRQRERATADSRRQKLDRRIKRHGSTVKTIMAIQGAIAAGKFFSKKYINDPDYSETCPNECASK